MSIFLHDWKDSGLHELISDFSGVGLSKAHYEATECPHANESYWRKEKALMADELAKEQWQGIEILLASYSYANYSGSAFVLFRKDGQLFEVNGSHCSCYGLEGQWEPEPTTIESLRHRLDKGSLGDDDYCENVFAGELRAVLTQIEATA